MMLTSTLFSFAGSAGNVIVRITESRSPFRVFRDVCDSNQVLPSARATSSRANTSCVSGVNILSNETSSSCLSVAPNRRTVASLTSRILTIDMACSTNPGCVAR